MGSISHAASATPGHSGEAARQMGSASVRTGTLVMVVARCACALSDAQTSSEFLTPQKRTKGVLLTIYVGNR